jgi:alpha-pyrone synthase
MLIENLKNLLSKRYPVILSLTTGNPKYKTYQKDALCYALKNTTNKEIVTSIYNNSLVETRYLGVPDFFEPDGEEKESEEDELFFKNKDMLIEDRLEKFKEIATPLVIDACSRSVADSGLKFSDIDKLIVVSSTGFFGPSLDCEIINALNLSKNVDRTLIGFMGCAAAINGIRVASDYVMAHPGKNALLVCVEISSVHTNFSDTINDAIIHAIFSDGVSACVLTGKYLNEIPKNTCYIADTYSHLMNGTEDGIELEINHNAIYCNLSKFLPKYISKNISSVIDKFLGNNELKKSDIDFWAVHPGGRRIIEEIETALELDEKALFESRTILKNYGNMLSPTCLFVLELIIKKNKLLLENREKGYQNGIVLSFSPGVGAECILLKMI